MSRAIIVKLPTSAWMWAHYLLYLVHEAPLLQR